MDTERLLKIIKAVKAHDCLWNASSPEYAKRHILEKAWTAVAQEVGHSEVFCREKWRNVRTGFLRSIQNNIRIVPDESSNDFQAVRRKRFYLFEHMKFLLPSVQALDNSRRRRRSAKLGNTNDSLLDDEYSDNTMMLEEFRSPVGKCEVNSDNEQSIDQEHSSHDEHQIDEESNSNYNQLLKELVKNDAVDVGDKDETNSLKRKLADGEEKEQVTNSNKKQATFPEQTSTDTELCPWKSYERESQQMLDFFRGNIDDILALSRRNQRRFKRKLLEIIEELHDAEDVNRN